MPKTPYDPRKTIPIRDWIDKPHEYGQVVVVLGATAPTVVHIEPGVAEVEAERLIRGLPESQDQIALVLDIAKVLVLKKAERPPIVALAPVTPANPADAALPADFIPWFGGDCPVAETTNVSVVFRDGGISGVGTDMTASCYNWKHGPNGPPSARRQIIGYRVKVSTSFRIEPGKFYITGSGARVGPMKDLGEEGDYGFATFAAPNDAVGKWFVDGTPFSGKSQPAIVALAADQDTGRPVNLCPPHSSNFFRRPFDPEPAPGSPPPYSYTSHEKAALEEQAGRPIDWASIVSLSVAATPTPKFKAGDAVTFPGTFGNTWHGVILDIRLVGSGFGTPYFNYLVMTDGGAFSVKEDRLTKKDKTNA